MLFVSKSFSIYVVLKRIVIMFWNEMHGKDLFFFHTYYVNMMSLTFWNVRCKFMWALKFFFHLPLNRMWCCMQLMEFYWLKKEWHFPSSYTNYHSVIVWNLKWRKARRRRRMMNQKCMNTNLHFKLCSQFFS